MCRRKSMDFLKRSFVLLVLYVGFSNVQSMRRRRPQKEQPEDIFLVRSRPNPEQNRNFRSTFGYAAISDVTNCIYDLCSNVTDYPTNYIRNMMSKRKEFHRFFGSVIQPYHIPTLSGKSPGNKETEEKNMCETVQFTYFPEIAVNRYRKRMVIVNVDKFRQAVSFETCVPKAKCFLSDHKPLGYETACKQQYNLIRLVTMTENGNFTLDTFPIPSSCVCTYKRVVTYN